MFGISSVSLWVEELASSTIGCSTLKKEHITTPKELNLDYATAPDMTPALSLSLSTLKRHIEISCFPSPS